MSEEGRQKAGNNTVDVSVSGVNSFIYASSVQQPNADLPGSGSQCAAICVYIYIYKKLRRLAQSRDLSITG